MAGKFDPSELAAEISARLQEKMVLVEKPVTTGEILEFPPIYVVGDVATPGEYRFRSGLTALQALALGGGILRKQDGASNDEIKLAGELQGASDDILLSKARITPRSRASRKERDYFSNCHTGQFGFRAVGSCLRSGKSPVRRACEGARSPNKIP